MRTALRTQCASFLAVASFSIALRPPSAAVAAEPCPVTATADAGRVEATLPEVEVTATRREMPPFESPRTASVVTFREIEEQQARTAPEALREAPGVHAQQTAYGQGSPFIRGLTGNQVLILVDGVRLNNSIFRFGANQYLATVDPFTIDRIEVLRGAGSVLYGSDALGGVVQVLTRAREERSRSHDLGGRAIGRYGSASKELTGRIELEGSAGPVGVLGGLTYSDFDDLTGGRNTGLQPNTGYRAEAGDAKASFFFDRHEITTAFQHLGEHNVPRSDRLNLALPGKLPPDLRMDFEPQQRELAYIAYRFEDPSLALAGIRSNLSFQRQLEGRIEVKRAKPMIEQHERDWVETWGSSIQLESAEVLRQVLLAGFEVYHDHVASRREDRDLRAGTVLSQRPRFADGGSYLTFGAFIQDEIRLIEDRLKLVVGGRYTRIEIEGSYADPNIGDVSLDHVLDSLTGSAHLWFSPVEILALAGGVGQGFRAPNFDDLSVFGQVGQGFEIPNPDAEPEQALSFEAGLKVRVPGREPIFTGSLCGHWTEFRDLLQRTQGEWLGLPFIDSNGNGIQEPGEENVVQRRNVGRARIFGVEIDGQLRLPASISLGGERWSVFGSFFWNYGMNLEDDEPLRGIPPAQGLVRVRADWAKGRYFVEGIGLFARDQERIASADSQDARIPPGGTPGYEVYSLRGGARFRLFRAPALLRPGGGEKDYDASLTLAIENILDRDYRVHGSGLNGPGTNAVVTLAVEF